ncbi:MAG: class I SAM-dependent methyltransferase [Fimbriimonadaceae bacterium]|nr:class I SAM-dependent methyltransferase [Fimbriimonadaceae bacterium]
MDQPRELAEKEQIEILFWRDSAHERPEADSLENLVNKLSEARVFLEKLSAFGDRFAGAQTILELGGGQGWASAMLKKRYPDKTLIASDISEFAIASVGKWERVFESKVDRTFACRAYEIPMEDASVDLVFCFAAAHHFVRHRSTMKELARVLRPGGAALYLHEPVCPPSMHKWAHRRVNRKRPEVPEDVLIYPEIVRLASEAGLRATVRFAPTTTNRGAIETVYYLAQQKLPFLRRLLPSSADFVIEKAG